MLVYIVVGSVREGRTTIKIALCTRQIS
ncbi:NADPH-dependent oxidoreductase, partial [Acinetobacter nosocomialis]|nr:NADPH-dependent oxidoreductase [Acinetobacter nosocomialis]